MKDEDKTKEQLISELAELRQRIAELDVLETHHSETEKQLCYHANLLEKVFDAIISTDMDFVIKSWNKAAERMYGWKAYEAIGIPLGKLIKPEYPNDSRDVVIQKFIEDGYYKGEVIHHRKDGTPITIWSAVSMLKDDDGNPVGAVSVNHDITKRKQAEEALRESEQRYRQLFESISDAVAIYNSQGRFLDCNEATLQRLGYSREEFLRLTPADIVHPDFHLVMKDNQKRIWAGETTIVESVYRCKDGRIIPVEVNSHCIEYQGEPAILTVARDITEQKLAEEELQKSNRCLSEALTELKATQQQIIQQERLRALGQIASGIAHDFNNTLVPILGYSDVMLTVPQILDDKEKTKNLLGMIRTSANDATNIVKRLAEFYRTREEGEVLIPLNLNQLVEQAIELTQPKWREQSLAAGVTVRILSDLQEVPHISGNESQLREVFARLTDAKGFRLANLIFNSVDAMPDGGLITIRTYLNGEYVVLEVSDTGIGMTEEVRLRCFEPFFSTKAGRGTGLGLSVVYGIIQWHKGMIAVDSEPGKGTTFTIRLPIQAEEQAESEYKEVEATIRSLHILLVDDEQLVLDVLTAYLTEGGHTFETATNGREGLEKFYKGKFDLVVTDRAMPDMNGIQMD